MISERHISYRGPAEVDADLLDTLPDDLQQLLSSINGFIAFNGALHVRGACHDPLWHSIANIWTGQLALHRTYGHLSQDDVPFAQDCMGDQFLLREAEVMLLTLETGFLTDLQLDLPGFLAAAEKDPLEFLQGHPLKQLQAEDSCLEPGQLIHAYPPFSTAQAADGVSLRAVPADQQIQYELDFYKSVRDLKDGETFEIKVIP